jgi:hypothetical protein
MDNDLLMTSQIVYLSQFAVGGQAKGVIPRQAE